MIVCTVSYRWHCIIPPSFQLLCAISEFSAVLGDALAHSLRSAVSTSLKTEQGCLFVKGPGQNISKWLSSHSEVTSSVPYYHHITVRLSPASPTLWFPSSPSGPFQASGPVLLHSIAQLPKTSLQMGVHLCSRPGLACVDHLAQRCRQSSNVPVPSLGLKGALCNSICSFILFVHFEIGSQIALTGLKFSM